MDVFDALRSRYTCRNFNPEPLLKGVLLEVLDAANRAPSWANSQPWEVYVAGGEALRRIRKGFMAKFDQGQHPAPDFPVPVSWPASLKQRIEEGESVNIREYFANPGDPLGRGHLRHNYMFFEAPAVIYLCMDRGLTAWSVFDMGLFAQSILLAAREKGLDTAPVYWLAAYPDLIREEMGIPDHLQVLFGIAVGQAAGERGHASPRRPIREVARFKGFGEGDTPEKS